LLPTLDSYFRLKPLLFELDLPNISVRYAAKLLRAPRNNVGRQLRRRPKIAWQEVGVLVLLQNLFLLRKTLVLEFLVQLFCNKNKIPQLPNHLITPQSSVYLALRVQVLNGELISVDREGLTLNARDS